MLWAVVEQHRNTMTNPITGGTIALGQRAHLPAGLRKRDFITVLVIAAMRALRHGQKRLRRIGLDGTRERVANGRRVVDRDHRLVGASLSASARGTSTGKSI